MLAPRCLGLFFIVAAAAGCQADPLSAPVATYVREPGAATSKSALVAGPALLYLNPCLGGCTFEPGPTDARTNHSSIVDETVTLPASTFSPESWDELHRCLYKHFKAFDLLLVDEEPLAGPYIEAVVAGTPRMLGLPESVGGISPMDCGFIDRGVNFNFYRTARTPEEVQAACDTIAHETGHTIGLDHTYFCGDLMTYLPECGEKSFVRADVQCGEHGPRQCACDTGQLQNSFIGVLRELGPRRTAFDLGPRVRLATPRTPDDTVESEFPIVVEARDDEGPVTRVEVSIDGTIVGTLTEPPYAFVAPAGLALGAHVVEARGYDEPGQVGRSVSAVEVTERVAPWDGGFFDANGPRPGFDASTSEASDAAIGRALPKTLEEGGCRCAGRGSASPWLYLLALPLLRRRR